MQALRVALDDMLLRTWRQCCEEAKDAWDVKAMVRKGIERLRRGHATVGGWKLTLADDLDARDVCLALFK
jgi:hypothetical protein